MVFVFQKYGKFWSISLSINLLISEEWRRCRHSTIILISGHLLMGAKGGWRGDSRGVLPHNIRGCLDKNAYYSIGRRTKRQHNYGGFLINSLESSANDKLWYTYTSYYFLSFLMLGDAMCWFIHFHEIWSSDKIIWQIDPNSNR